MLIEQTVAVDAAVRRHRARRGDAGIDVRCMDSTFRFDFNLAELGAAQP